MYICEKHIRMGYVKQIDVHVWSWSDIFLWYVFNYEDYFNTGLCSLFVNLKLYDFTHLCSLFVNLQLYDFTHLCSLSVYLKLYYFTHVCSLFVNLKLYDFTHVCSLSVYLKLYDFTHLCSLSVYLKLYDFTHLCSQRKERKIEVSGKSKKGVGWGGYSRVDFPALDWLNFNLRVLCPNCRWQYVHYSVVM